MIPDLIQTAVALNSAVNSMDKITNESEEKVDKEEIVKPGKLTKKFSMKEEDELGIGMIIRYGLVLRYVAC